MPGNLVSKIDDYQAHTPVDESTEEDAAATAPDLLKTCSEAFVVKPFETSSAPLRRASWPLHVGVCGILRGRWWSAAGASETVLGTRCQQQEMLSYVTTEPESLV